MQNLYKWIWTRMGGRPFTYVLRDVWHQHEYIAQAFWFWIGLAVYHYMGMQGVGIFWVIYTFGYINGHFFWGTRYKAWQE